MYQGMLSKMYSLTVLLLDCKITGVIHGAGGFVHRFGGYRGGLIKKGFQYMIVLSTHVGQVSLWTSDKVGLKNVSLEGINVNPMNRYVRHIVFWFCSSVLGKLTSTMFVLWSDKPSENVSVKPMTMNMCRESHMLC